MKKTITAMILTTALIMSTSCNTQNTSSDSESINDNATTTIAETTIEETTVETTEETTEDPSLKLIAPSEEYVISCLKTVADITDIEAATEDHDPNGGLNKQGKYIAAIYFRTTKLNIYQKDNGYYCIENENGNEETFFVDEDEDINSPVDMGTDGGGQIEVYRTVEDATARDEYLGKLDSSVLASGSHIVVGTMVIRTSDYLTATQQQELTNAVIEALENG